MVGALSVGAGGHSSLSGSSLTGTTNTDAACRDTLGMLNAGATTPVFAGAAAAGDDIGCALTGRGTTCVTGIGTSSSCST